MSESWLGADLDPIRRLRVMAAALPGAVLVEHVIPAPYDHVWAVASDLEANVPRYQPHVTSIRILGPTADPEATDRFAAEVRSLAGIGNRFTVILRPGWCLMQSSRVLVGMAARPESGQTRFARLHLWRVPGAILISPFVRGRVRAELRSLDRLVRELAPKADR